MRLKTKPVIYLFIILFLINFIIIGYNISKNDLKVIKVKAWSIKLPTVEETKLARLNNINLKIDFFKLEYLDRYLNYKANNPKLENEQIIIDVNIGLDNPFFTNTKDSLYKHTNMVIANKYYYLGSDYIPKNLTKISGECSLGNHSLEKSAAEAFEKLCKDAIKNGYSIKANSTYRSYNTQKYLYNSYTNNYGKKSADTFSARPGYSEHQTGLAIDVAKGNATYLKFGSTNEFKWMLENSHKYGYILRYTEEYIPITGYISEPWHYRYVGVEIATYIHEHPMTYEEYFVRFLDKEKAS